MSAESAPRRLVLLLAVVFRPVFVQRREEVKQAEVVVLMDDSASMRRKDARILGVFLRIRAVD